MFRTLLSVKRLHFVSLLNLFNLLAELLVHVLIVTPFSAAVNTFLKYFFKNFSEALTTMILLYVYLVSLSRPVLKCGKNVVFLPHSTFVNDSSRTL